MNKILLTMFLMLIPSACGSASYPKVQGVYCMDRNGRSTIGLDNAVYVDIRFSKRYVYVRNTENVQIIHYMLDGETCMIGPPVFPQKKKDNNN